MPKFCLLQVQATRSVGSAAGNCLHFHVHAWRLLHATLLLPTSNTTLQSMSMPMLLPSLLSFVWLSMTIDRCWSVLAHPDRPRSCSLYFCGKVERTWRHGGQRGSPCQHVQEMSKMQGRMLHSGQSLLQPHFLRVWSTVVLVVFQALEEPHSVQTSAATLA